MASSSSCASFILTLVTNKGEGKFARSLRECILTKRKGSREFSFSNSICAQIYIKRETCGDQAGVGSNGFFLLFLLFLGNSSAISSLHYSAKITELQRPLLYPFLSISVQLTSIALISSNFCQIWSTVAGYEELIGDLCQSETEKYFE